ncbi:pirin family protein [Simiduia agarivorans]|uniref:Pirin domain protein n=1 Tax=Simiduia agarivorans (strain DSM 21679 / JCM 13881 / BCRC 17597 / SA1) TaxID=1117647 RepID=K4L3H7_SIMAS|nr:pirin family protein [Simiduia agarivorans]AFV00738.1 pirin domain protein [Simiduia agarivorans SA1 = DSM 21679]
MRQPIRILKAQPSRDGAGVNLMRSLGSQALPDWNPFLLLDEIRSDEAADYIAGFPEHPHRGFETVTIMLEGKMRHRDSRGNEGVIESGGVQWMTAGSGLTHAEMPEQTSGRLWGFQLWVNLPAEHKMMAPRYQDIPANAIPVIERPDAKLRLMAGELDGHTGPVTDIVSQPTLIDLSLTGDVTLNVPERSFVYVYQGEMNAAGKSIPAQHLALLSNEGALNLSGNGKALVVGANALHEPIARHGPFVMNTRAELLQAFEDYQNGVF